MLYNTEAYVIRSIPYGETHAIVTLLTPSGTIAAMARGAKKPQSRLAGGVQLGVKALYTVYQGRGMGNIQQLEVLDSYRQLREQLDLAAYAAYFCELVTSVSEERPNGSEIVYRWFDQALSRLRDGRESASTVARIWEAKVLRLLGASPKWDECIRCGAQLTGNNTLYTVRDGGFICERCFTQEGGERHDMRGVLSVPPSVPKVLEQFRVVPFERIGQVNLGASTLEGIRSVLRYQLADYGGLSLKSREFVDSIDELWK